jgi:DNA-directed RNA polymerase subunit K/omega
MDEITETPEVVDQPSVPDIPTEPAPPISSRFMFVDVAALRAKQLRRGARLRFEAEPGIPTAIKLERLAMEEVKRGLVHYSVPPVLAKLPDESAS